MEKKNIISMHPIASYKTTTPYPPSRNRHHHYSISSSGVLNHKIERDSLNALATAHEYHHNHCIEKNKKYFDTRTTTATQDVAIQKNTKSNHSHVMPHQKHNGQTQQQITEAKIRATTAVTTPFEQLQAVHAKATTIRSKNEEAINDLRTRIPEIETIFDIHNRIGNGTFSTVLLATLKKDQHLSLNSRRQFAIKHHIPTSHPDRIMKELECMAKIGGTDNVVGINCCLRYNESVAFVMPYLPHDRFHDFFQKMDVPEVQFYMKNLFIALRHVHRFNVIHRDVKPSNFLYNRKKKEFLLVDFGLAQQVPQRSQDQYVCPHMLQHQQQQQQQQHQRDCDNNTMKPIITSNASGAGNNKRPREESSTARTKGDNAGDHETDQAKRIKLSCNVDAANEKMPLKQINEIQQKVGENFAAARVAGGACLNTNTIQTNGVGVTNNGTSAVSGNVPVAAGGSTTTTAIAGNTGTKYNTNRNSIASQNAKCNCYGNPQVCNICLVKKEVYASRAGTPGYRPPEVLLKYADQTTAVDIWAAGVIFLSVLSSVYPFFKAPNDYMALAEMVTIFGDKAISKTAFVLDRLVTLSQKSKPLDLRKLCVRFRNRQKFSSPEMLRKYQKPNGTCDVCSNCDQYHYNCLCVDSPYKTEPFEADDIFPLSAYDLLNRLLEVNPHKRITAEEALKHPFITETYYSFSSANSNSMRLPTSVHHRIAASNHHHHSKIHE